MARLLVALGISAALVALAEACAEINGFHCLEFQWNCNYPWRSDRVERWRCYDDHCCWCSPPVANEQDRFRRLCTAEDFDFSRHGRNNPILVNPNFDCNFCPRGFFCTYQEDVGLPGPDNGCSRGVRRFFRSVANRKKRAFDPKDYMSSAKISHDVSLMYTS